MIGRSDSLLDRAVMMCVAPSKKKNYPQISALSMPCLVNSIRTLEAVNVLITIIKLAATTANKPVMFIARKTLRIMNPGPASRLLVTGISDDFSEERRRLKKLTGIWNERRVQKELEREKWQRTHLKSS